MEHHATAITVRYGETDAMGVAHHASYLAWLETGRVELMRSMGFSYREMEASGTAFPVIEARLRYHKPVRFNEVLTLETLCLAVTRTRVRFGYIVLRDGEKVAHGYTEHAALGERGRPGPIPEGFRLAIEEHRADSAETRAFTWAVR